MESKRVGKPFQIKRWMVISLIPLAYCIGYVNAEDERIEQIEKLQKSNQQLIQKLRGPNASVV